MLEGQQQAEIAHLAQVLQLGTVAAAITAG
jgi:hypothetical protein